MGDIYSLAVKISLDSTAFSAGAGVVMRVFNSIQRSAGITGSQIDKLGRSLALFAAGAALTGAGVIGAHVLGGWVKAAGALQSAMAGVGLATTGTARQLAALQSQTFITANKTQFSAPDIANIEKIAATNGLNQRDVLLRVVPTLGNLAEIDQRLRGIGYAQSVPAAITVAHDFQSYPRTAAQAKSFNSLLDLFGRSQLVAGTSPDAMAKLVTYLSPARAAYNLSPSDIISTAALASNVGLAGGKGGGSRIMAMFRAIAPLLSSRGALHNKALGEVEKLGGGTFFKNGDFEAAGGVANMLTIVERSMSHIKDQGKRMALLGAAFGAAGSTAMSVMATPGAVARFQSIQGLLAPPSQGGLASTQTMQTTLNNTLQGQMATLQGNLTSITALLGQQLLPAIAPVVHGFVELTGWVVTLLRTQPQVAQFIAVFAAVTTAAALIAGPILMAAGAFGILSAAGVVADITFLPFTATVMAIVGAVTLVVLAVTHWSDITRFLGQTVQGVGRQIGGFLGLAGDLLGVFGQIASAGAHMLGLDTFSRKIASIVGSMAAWVSEVLHLKDAFAWAGSEVQAFLKWADLLQKHPANLHRVVVPAGPSHPGTVHATAPLGGSTVGLPSYLYLPPIKGAKGHVGGGGAVWDMPPVQGRAGARGAAPVYNLHIAPGAVGPIHVTGAAGHDEEALAARVGAHVVRGMGDELVHALTSGAPSILGLSPVLNTPVAR